MVKKKNQMLREDEVINKEGNNTGKYKLRLDWEEFCKCYSVQGQFQINEDDSIMHCGASFSF